MLFHSQDIAIRQESAIMLYDRKGVLDALRNSAMTAPKIILRPQQVGSGFDSTSLMYAENTLQPAQQLYTIIHNYTPGRYGRPATIIYPDYVTLCVFHRANQLCQPSMLDITRETDRPGFEVSRSSSQQDIVRMPVNAEGNHKWWYC